jgi:hypothetical protein
MRLIDADALIEWLSIVPLENGMINPDVVVELIRTMPDCGGWISVKDRLPDKSGKYLVAVTSNVDCKPFVKTAWFLLKLWDNWQFKYECEPNVPGFYNGDGEGDWVERMVTHWMPLPEPPAENEDE